MPVSVGPTDWLWLAEKFKRPLLARRNGPQGARYTDTTGGFPASWQVIAGTTIDVPRPRARSSVSYLSSARSFLFWFPIPLERGFLFLRFPILPNRFPIPLEGFPIYGFPISLEPPRMVSYLRYGVSYYSRAGFLFLRFPISHSFLFYAGRQYLYYRYT